MSRQLCKSARLQQARECHPEIVGHRCVFSFRVFGETTKNENHTMADVVNGLLLDLHAHGDSNGYCTPAEFEVMRLLLNFVSTEPEEVQ